MTSTSKSTSTALPGSAAAAQAAASAAVAELEEEMSGQAQAAMTSVNLSALSTGAQVTEIRSPSGKQITVAVMSAEGARNNGGSLSIDVGGGKLSVEIQMPVSALESVSFDGPVAVAASSMDEAAVAAFTNAAVQSAEATGEDLPPPPKLEAPPLSLTLYDEEGNALPVQHLEEPITLTLAPIGFDNMSCVFWNETLGAWDDSGMERYIDENSTGLICLTWHLSVFGAVSGFITDIGKEFANLVECSNAGSLFSANAAAKIFQGAPRHNATKSDDKKQSGQDAVYLWWKGGPAACVWTSLAVLGACLAVASLIDIREAQRLKRARKDQVQPAAMELKRLNSKRQDHDEHSAVSKIRKIVVNSLQMLVAVFGGACASLLVIWKLLVDLPNGPQRMVTRAVTKVQTLHLNVDEDSMDDMIKVQRKSHASMEHLVSKTNAIAGDRCFSQESDYSMERFLEGNLLQRTYWLFMATHPLVLVLTFSLRLSHMARMFLIIVKIMSAGACTALLYQSTGALSADMPPECFEERDAFREIMKSAATGVVSSLLSDGMLGILATLRGEQCPELAMLENNGADEGEDLLKARKTAHIRLVMFWFVGTSYTLLSLYVVICYLANVGYDDALGFVQAYVIVFIEDFVIEPLAVALLLGIVSSIILCCSRDVIFKVKVSKRQLGSNRRAAAFEGHAAMRGDSTSRSGIDDAEDTDQFSRPSSACSARSYIDGQSKQKIAEEEPQQLSVILPVEPEISVSKPGIEYPSSPAEEKAEQPAWRRTLTEMALTRQRLQEAVDQCLLPGEVLDRAQQQA